MFGKSLIACVCVLWLAVSAFAQDKGTLNPKPLPPLANPDDPKLAAKELFGRKTTAAPEYYRHMLGWNRRALKVTLPTTGTPAVIRALETLCVVAARQAKQ